MKSILLSILVSLLLLTQVAMADGPQMKASVAGGFSYMKEGETNLGFNLGGIFKYSLANIDPNLSVEGIITYNYFLPKEEHDYKYNYSMIEILGGANYNVAPNINLLGGLGFYQISVDFEYTGNNEYMQAYNSSASDTKLGLFIGGEFQLNNTLSGRLIMHIPNFDPDFFYLNINVAYSFPL